MNLPNTLSRALGVVALFTALFAVAYPGESITRDPVTGDYTIIYWDDSTEDSNGNPIQPRLRQTTFIPATKIIPVIHSKFWPHGPEYVRYGYSVFNGNAAKQTIVVIRLEKVGRVLNEQDVRLKTASESELENAIFANMSALDSPSDWNGNIYRERSRITWQADDLERGGVLAGRIQSGFGFFSFALPGISEVRMEGLGGVFGYTGEGPAEDSAILKELTRLQDNDFVSRNAAIPTIAIPDPFDVAVLMGRIRAETLTWGGKQLLDPTFAAQIDRYMVSATEAYRRNQTKAGKEHIETLREMLKREHNDLERDDEEEGHDGNHGEKNNDRRTAISQRILIDRLAARVLDFNLRYVLKRMEREPSEGERRK